MCLATALTGISPHALGAEEQVRRFKSSRLGGVIQNFSQGMAAERLLVGSDCETV